MSIFDFDVLQCPMCLRQLVAIELDIIDVEGERFQRIWWSCSGLKAQACQFPTFLPENVFWTQRSMKQMKNGFFPLPNLHLLPREYWHLYPKLFDEQKGPAEVRLIGRKMQKLVHSLSSGRSFDKDGKLLDGKENNETNVDFRPSTSAGLTRACFLVGNEVDCLDSTCHDFGTEESSNNRAGIANEEPDTLVTQHAFLDLDQIADEGDNGGLKLRSSVAAARAPTKKAQLNGGRKRSSDFPLELKDLRNTHVSPTATAHIRSDETTDLSIDFSLQDSEVIADDQSDTDSELVSSLSSDVMSRLISKHRNLVKKKKAVFDAHRIALKKQIKKRGYTLDSSVVPYADLSQRKRKPSSHLPLVDEGVPAEDFLEDKEMSLECEDYMNLLKQPKVEPMEESLLRRTLIRSGESTQFCVEHFPSSIVDPVNWYRPVQLGGRSALDGFMAWYNLRFNKKPYLECLAGEMCRSGVLKFVPSLPIKQQRMVKQLHEEAHGRKSIDIEKLKKSFDPACLRMQVAHRLGLPNVEPSLESKASTSKETEKRIGEREKGQMEVIGSVPLGKVALHSVRSQPSIAERKGCFPFLSKHTGLGSVSEEMRKSASLPDLEKLNLPKHVLSMMSDYVMTGNAEVDELLQKKVVNQMKQVMEDKEILRKENSLKRQQESEKEVANSSLAKQRRISEAAQRSTKESGCYDNLEGVFGEYYDDDDEFCTQIYGSQNL